MNLQATRPSDVAAARGVEEVLHFTTSRGLIGILASKKLLSRRYLSLDDYLENIRYYNTASRSRDIDWIGHVSMSLTQVNSHMLAKSMTWHEEDKVWWAVLAFDPEILDHPGVVFCTSNNVYPTTQRAEGAAGFEAMFAPTVVWGMYDTPVTRRAGMADNLTTHFQAELLYPGVVDLSFLRAIYVREPDQVLFVRSLLAAIGPGPGPDLTSVRVECNPTVFVTG